MTYLTDLLLDCLVYYKVYSILNKGFKTFKNGEISLYYKLYNINQIHRFDYRIVKNRGSFKQ